MTLILCSLCGLVFRGIILSKARVEGVITQVWNPYYPTYSAACLKGSGISAGRVAHTETPRMLPHDVKAFTTEINTSV